MIKNILTIIFALLGLVYGFNNIGRLFFKERISGFQILAMAIGIVGFFACTSMTW